METQGECRRPVQSVFGREEQPGRKDQPPTDPTFRVESNGNVESRGSIYIANSNGEKLAGLSGGGTSGNSVRIWAGNATPVNAPFKVYQNGDAYIGGLRMESGGLFSDNRYSGESSSKFFLYSSGSNAFWDFHLPANGPALV